MSKSVRVERLGDSDSGIVELKVGRPEAKNTIEKEMLRRLQFGCQGFLRRGGSQVRSNNSNNKAIKSQLLGINWMSSFAGQLNWVDRNLEESDLLKLVESQEADECY
ncbi:hypothetical protein OPV22_001775 [Ensete ventricosum]|uniref:Uncharacterized protein n=1 Tax=Ensete ventricosum TaxID=4639 RepID=A0AAV8QDB1_ENSVE|nr:hypothetical protein OPV22_001775 [Ensete ventricosum]